MRTSCATEEELVALYQRDCDDVSIFLATDKELSEGGEVAFSLELADGTPMVRGIGVVINVWRTADNRFGRAGAHIAFGQLTSASEPVLERMLEMRAITESQPRRRSGNTQIRFGIAPSPGALAGWADEESVVGDVRRSITNELTSPEPSAGTPATFVEGPSNNTSRYEGPIRAPAIPAPRAPQPRPPLPNVMGLAPVVPITPAASPTPQELGAAAIVPVAVAPSPADAPTQPRAPIVVPPEPSSDESAPLLARGSSPSTPRLARASTPALEPTITLPIPPPPHTEDSAQPLLDSGPHSVASDWHTPTTFAKASQWSRQRLSRVADWLGAAYRRLGAWLVAAYRWMKPHLAAAYQRVVERTGPAVRAMWQSRARTPIVFAAGILVGVLASGWLRTSPPAPVASVPPSLPSEHALLLARTQCRSSDVAAPTMTGTEVASATPTATMAPSTTKKIVTKQPTMPSAPAARAVKKSPIAPTAAPTKSSIATSVQRPATMTKPPATKPVATATAKPATVVTKPAATATAKPATVVTKPATTATAKPATKPVATATAKPATVVTKPATTAIAKPATKPATTAIARPATKPATTATAKPATVVTKAAPAPRSTTRKPPCGSLDCI